MPNTRRWTKNEIVRVLRERLAANESCNVAALRMAGLGALYNAAQKLFAEEYAAVGNNWAGLLRHLLAVNECRRIAARHRWTRETVEQILRHRYEQLGRDGASMRANVMIAAGYRGLYLWVTRQAWYREEFGGCWPRYLCNVLGIPYPDGASQFSGSTYAADGSYIGEPIELTAYERELLDGLLLGDGCLVVDARNPARQAATFRLTSKYLAVAQWAAEHLPSLGGGIHSRVETLEYTTKQGESREAQCPKSIYFSRATPHLLPLTDRWYVTEHGVRRKIVPRDLRLTPTLALGWYLGDGGASYSRHGRASLRLATHSFDKAEVRRLCTMIREAGIGCAIDGVWGSTDQWALRIPVQQAERFLSYIGPPPIKELAHRWRLTRPGG